MRIAVMLRAMDENQGIGIYARNVLPRMLQADPDTEYVLIRQTAKYRGRFAAYPNAIDVELDLSAKGLWDQVGVPWIARKYGVDVIFNTKFTLPLLDSRPAAMVLHGSMQFVHPELFHPVDIAYLRALMPVYLRRATHLISNSQLTTDDFIERLHVPPEKITTLHLAADDHFAPVTDSAVLDGVRQKYRLPERYILSVTKYFPGKNVATLLEAYATLPAGSRPPLVLVGHNVDRYLDDLHLRNTPLARDIVLPGWVDQRDLPAIYSMADLFVFPSIYEEFGIPLVEAMACGCPIVGSNTAAIPEITAGAAQLVDPRDAEALADAMQRVLEDCALRATFRERGFARARKFSWAEHARGTVDVLHHCAGQAYRARSWPILATQNRHQVR